MPRYYVPAREHERANEPRSARTGTRAWWEWWDVSPTVPSPTVYPTNGPVDTGLLNANGERIYRAPEPIGFLPLGITPAKQGE